MDITNTIKIFSSLQRRIFVKDELTPDEWKKFDELKNQIESYKDKCSICERNKPNGIRKTNTIVSTKGKIINTITTPNRKCVIKNVETFNLTAQICNSFKLHLL